MITTKGLEALLTDGYAQFDYIEVGTGSTAAAVGDTALETPITAGGRAAIVTKMVASNVLTLEGLFTSAQGNGAIREVGIYDAVSGGNLLWRHVFSVPHTKLASKSAIVQLVITLTNAS